MDEAVASAWPGRQLERQISTLYYERLLASRGQSSVKAEADELTAPLAAENFIKDPYVLEFLDLKTGDAVQQYKDDRDPRDLLFSFKHFKDIYSNPAKYSAETSQGRIDDERRT